MLNSIIASGPLALLRWLLLLPVIAPIAFAHDLPMDRLNLPPGFRISVFAEVINPRQLAISPGGVVFSGSKRGGEVYAIMDDDRDGEADRVISIDRGLTQPTGIAFRDGDLYVGDINRLMVYRDVVKKLEQNLIQDLKPVIITDRLPHKRHHGWKYLGFGPDNLLYFNIGAPCNICLSDNPWFASIMRVDIDKQPLDFQVFAQGVRNSVGFDWHPITNELWFTDNGRDRLGDTRPPDELNHAIEPGLHFGYPYFHGNGIPDPEFGRLSGADNHVKPARLLGAHVAPLGMIFYQGDMFPPEYKNAILIAEHGSWNRSLKAGHVGYRITVVREVAGHLAYEPFIDGWLQNNSGWGRPADLLAMPDGSVLISDDTGNVIYRLAYEER
jgi:glucose/arabinose dehydrogenase